MLVQASLEKTVIETSMHSKPPAERMNPRKPDRDRRILRRASVPNGDTQATST
jgi:hypothetical protein